MKKARIEAKPKIVEAIQLTDGSFPRKAGIDPTPFKANIADIRAHIIAGQELPAHYYRKSKGRDHLLAEKGWLHLHVGYDSDDNILLIVEQTDDKVIFIGLTDHDIFDEVPRGKSFARLGSKIAAIKLSKYYKIKPRRTK